MRRTVTRAWHHGGVGNHSFPIVLRLYDGSPSIRDCAACCQRYISTYHLVDALYHHNDDETCACRIPHPLAVHQPYAMALSGSLIVVSPVTLNVRLRANLQKNANNSCQERATQNRIVSITMSIGEECMGLRILMFGFRLR